MKFGHVFAVAGFAAAMLNPLASFAEEKGTADEAKALLSKAKAHFESVGAEQAYKDFATAGGDWHDRDLYVFCFAPDGVMLSHGANSKLIGKNLANLKDADGRLFTMAIIEAGLGGGGQVDYDWANPTTKKVEPKTSFVEKFGESVCGVGIYR